METRIKQESNTQLIDILKARDASEVVTAFLEWLKWAEELQKSSWQIVLDEDAKNQDFFHEMEFESNNKKRSVIATRLHNSRVRRRKAKDISKKLKPVTDYVKEATARSHIKHLKKMAADLKKEEDFVNGERTYKPRSTKEENNDGVNH